jgi:glycine cleavage system aminomethyltransferase T/glycine/D-amino acid oxidase-like deaminating enzyme
LDITMESPRVVVIGAGIVGANLADELTERGWTDVTVLDRGPIPHTGGSTSHAPGLVFQSSPSELLSELAAYTGAKLHGLVKDGAAAFNPVGGLEVATTPERLAELHRRNNFNACWGVESRVVDAAEAKRLHPLVDESLLLGGLYVPTDGLASSLLAVELLRRRAESRGAVFRENTLVTGIEEASGQVTGVRCGDEVVPADIVICAGGFWGPELGEMAGMTVPLVPMAHQYARTTSLPSLRGEVEEAVGTGNNARLPILRLQEDNLYFRQHGSRIGIGSYGHRPIPVDYAQMPSEVDVMNDRMPSRLEFTPEDFEPAWRDSQRLLPELAQTTVEDAFNGIFSFTPDGGALVGEATNVAGLYVAEAVWVTHSAGVARALAQVLVDGHSDADLREMDLHRFEKVQLERDYIQETSAQSFVEVYHIKHPLQPKVSPRNLRLSPFFERQQDLGAFFLEAAGWERPHWYEANASLLENLPQEWVPPQRDAWSGQYHSPISAAEAHATRTNVAMYDMTALRRVDITGEGAESFLDHLATGNMRRKIGAVAYTLLLDEAGGIRSDITVARLGDERFMAGINGGIDANYLAVEARRFTEAHPECPVSVEDITDSTCCIGLWGPNARTVVQPLTDQDLTNDGLKYFQGVETEIAGIPVRLLRLSYVGELGWEIYAAAEDGARLWDALWEAGAAHGIIAAGRGAFNSLRLEKGYRSWGTDMHTGHYPDQAGLGFAVKKDKVGYVGEHALADRAGLAGSGRGRALRCLTVDDGTTVLTGRHEPVLVDGAPAGFVTSADFGYTVHRPIALAWVPEDLAPGDQVTVRTFDREVQATIAEEPLVDPAMEKLRS